MSKLKAFVTALILTGSSAAMADASFSARGSARVTFGSSDWSQPVVRDHRTPRAPVDAYRPRVPTHSAAAWHTLAAELTTNNGPLVIYPDNRVVFSQIRLETVNATAIIEGVTVQFANGTSKFFQPVNKTLDGNNPTFVIQVNNQMISKITIESWSAGALAQFKVIGYGSTIHAEPAPYPTPAPSYEVTLAHDVTFGRSGRRSIVVENQPRRLNALRLQSVTGSVYLTELTVRYTDGTSETFDNINKRMRIGETVEFEVGHRGKQIDRLVVYADARRSPGALSIVAI